MTENHAIIPLDESAALESVQVLCNIVRAIREKIFVEGTDYGVIPGTGPKPVLLLPGMEKLMRALRLRPEYALLSVKEDFQTPLFYFRYECRLIEIDTGLTISTAIGSANSMEAKWRWREARRVCPVCGRETINRSKKDDGWYCWAKIGGCGAQFGGSDRRILEQQVGRVENPDIYDQLNTIDKIAQKRALASAIKVAANVSEFFTVDIEDSPRASGMLRSGDIVDGEYSEVPAPGAATRARTAVPARPPAGGVLGKATPVRGTEREDRAGEPPAAWWQNPAEVRRVKGLVMVRYRLSLEDALARLESRLSDFDTPDALLAALQSVPS